MPLGQAPPVWQPHTPGWDLGRDRLAEALAALGTLGTESKLSLVLHTPAPRRGGSEDPLGEGPGHGQWAEGVSQGRRGQTWGVAAPRPPGGSGHPPHPAPQDLCAPFSMLSESMAR